MILLISCPDNGGDAPRCSYHEDIPVSTYGCYCHHARGYYCGGKCVSFISSKNTGLTFPCLWTNLLQFNAGKHSQYALRLIKTISSTSFLDIVFV